MRSLDAPARDLFNTIYDVRVEQGVTVPPEEMEPWLRQQFGSVQAVRSQRIVKILNNVTLEGALYNPLRALRPMPPAPPLSPDSPTPDDPLRDPVHNTTEDPFGRVLGYHAVTGANIAKADVHHAVIVFDEFDPLSFDTDLVVDYLDTAWQWVETANRHNKDAIYPFILWNVGERAGSSVTHGHAQALLGKGRHYAQVEALRRSAAAYVNGGISGYFRDIFAVQNALGLASESNRTRTYVSLTPRTGREVVTLASGVDHDLFREMARVLTVFRDYLGVRAFNVALTPPPLSQTSEDWSGFPVVVRYLDRGNPDARPSGLATMELYGEPVIASNPFEVARALLEK